MIALPAGDGAEAFVDAADITGPEALTHAEVAQRIGAASGREVRYLEVSRRDWLAGAGDTGVPAQYAELLADLLEVIRSGHGARPTEVVAELTGRPARAFESFAFEAVRAGAWLPREQRVA